MWGDAVQQRKNDTSQILRALRAMTLACAALTGPLASKAVAQAPTPPPCTVICAPTMHVLPSVIRSHIFGSPEVRSMSTGAVHSLPATTNFELILSMMARTRIPRTSLLANIAWLPTAKGRANPFTEYTASELGTDVRANMPSLTLGANVDLVPAARTHGWLDLGGIIADQYSSAQRPSDASAYTHKLELDLVASVGVFNWLPQNAWFRNVDLITTLDYVATGLPKAGDEVPLGERRFLTNARPAALIFSLSFPLAPAKGK